MEREVKKEMKREMERQIKAEMAQPDPDQKTYPTATQRAKQKMWMAASGARHTHRTTAALPLSS